VAELIMENNEDQLNEVLDMTHAGSSVILEADAVLHPYVSYVIRKIASGRSRNKVVLHPEVNDKKILEELGHGRVRGHDARELRGAAAENMFAALKSYCDALAAEMGENTRETITDVSGICRGPLGLRSIVFEPDGGQESRKPAASASRHVLVLENADFLFSGGREEDGKDFHDLIGLMKNLPNAVFILLHDPSIEMPGMAPQMFPAIVPLSPLKRGILWKSVHEDVRLSVMERAKGFGEHAEKIAEMILWQECARLNLHQVCKLLDAWPVMPGSVASVMQFIRTFRAPTLAHFSPVDKDEIGGYYVVRRWLDDYLIAPYRLWCSSDADELKRMYMRCITRGICFEGDSGNGKTMLARWLATELAAYLEVVNAAEVRTKYVGDSEARISQIFKRARMNSPSIIVFDEFDAIASQRQMDTPNRVDSTIVNTLLTEMSGLSGAGDDRLVIVITTTNMWDAIDFSIRKRPERIGDLFTIGNPVPEDLDNRSNQTWSDGKTRMKSLLDVFWARYPEIQRAGAPEAEVKAALVRAISAGIGKADGNGGAAGGLSCDEIQDVFRSVERRIVLNSGPQPKAGRIGEWADERIHELLGRRRRRSGGKTHSPAASEDLYT